MKVLRGTPIIGRGTGGSGRTEEARDLRFLLRASLGVKLPAAGTVINVSRLPKPAESFGIFRYPEILARLLLATPLAFLALSRSTELLRRLDDELKTTGRLDAGAIKTYRIKQEGRDSAKFVLDEKMGGRYFGLCLNYPEELHRYRLGVRQIEDSREPQDIVIHFHYQGVSVKEAAGISPLEWQSLRTKFERETRTVSSIAINDGTAHVYTDRPDGSSAVSYSRELLKREQRAFS
jgi:hypothetical protein